VLVDDVVRALATMRGMISLENSWPAIAKDKDLCLTIAPAIAVVKILKGTPGTQTPRPVPGGSSRS
jgi:hypothetical protein